MSRPRHPSKEIEYAVRYAESLGWELRWPASHARGRLYCPHRGRDGCKFSVWSTPRDADNHARHIRREVDRCPHAPETTDEEGEADDD